MLSLFTGLDTELGLRRSRIVLQIQRKNPGLSCRSTMSDEYMLRVEHRLRVDSRYYGLPGGCVRGEKCFYAHGQDELQKRSRESSPGLLHSTASSRLQIGKINHSQEDLARKVFVGGLSSSVESSDLREFFEEKFGPVMEAVVIESHLGDQVHSRGFGFVTFENEKSVLSAVQAHFVNIFGKKVEIKGAVPRLGSSQLITSKGSSGMPTATDEISREASKSDLIRQRLLDFNLSSVITSLQTENDAQGWKGDTSLSLNGCKEAACAKTSPPTAPSCSPQITAEGRGWVPIFEQWLPKFLLEVCSRLKEGEWYPLSSLKGDFRATCGLELEHEAIGFHKLNDFIRSLPHLCRIKIVPVGVGPATHMVLLPAGSRMTTNTQQIQELHPSGPRAGTSLVETGRTYAAAICQGTISSGNGSVSSGSIALANKMNSFSREQAVQASICSDQIAAAWKARDTVNLNFLRQPNTLMEKSAGKENSWDTGRGFPTNGQLPNFIHQNCIHCMNAHLSSTMRSEFHYPTGIHDPSDFFIHQVPQCNSRTKTMEIGACGQEGPEIPLEQLTLAPSSNFNKYELSVPPTYSTSWAWEQNVSSNPVASVQQSSPGSTLREESAHDHANLRPLTTVPRVVGKAGGPLQKQFLLHPIDKDREKVAAACCHCKRKAIWVAFPCKHCALCSVCRDSMYRHWGKDYYSSCPVCFRAVEKWYGLYH